MPNWFYIISVAIPDQFCYSSNSFIHHLQHDFSCRSILSLFSFSLQFSLDEIIYSHGFSSPLYGSGSQNYTSAQVSHLSSRPHAHILILDSHRFLKVTMSKIDLLTLLSPTSASFISVNDAIYLVAQAGHVRVAPDPSLCCIIHPATSKLSMVSILFFNRHCFYFGLYPCYLSPRIICDFSDIHDTKLVSFVLPFTLLSNIS